MYIRIVVFVFLISNVSLIAQESKDTNVIELQIKEVTITATKNNDVILSFRE